MNDLQNHIEEEIRKEIEAHNAQSAAWRAEKRAALSEQEREEWDRDDREQEEAMVDWQREDEEFCRTSPIAAKLATAFDVLRGDGYVAMLNWLCCTNCCHRTLAKYGADLGVFCHGQDWDNLKESGDVWVGWRGDPEHIIRRLREAGLVVEWEPRSVNGVTQRIHVVGGVNH
jgi:hypothetical protein